MIKEIWSKLFPKKATVKVGDCLHVEWKGTRGKNKIIGAEIIGIERGLVSIRPIRAREGWPQ